MPLNSPTPKFKGPHLFVVTTPIGNLADITLRALQVLTEVDLIAAEDTRHTRRLLKAHDIENRLISYHEHNEARRTEELIQRLAQGETIALVSNAGTPTVSDPGYRLVHAAAAQRIPVTPVPGVSAAVTALSAAGLPTDRFTFVGFPARKKAKRLEQLRELGQLPHTLIFYQAPGRLKAFLNEMLKVLGNRQAVLAREMTKMHEEFLRGSLEEIIAIIKQRQTIKGECTLVVQGGSAEAKPATQDLQVAIEVALDREALPLGELSRKLARQFKVSRKQVYDMALIIKEKAEGR